MQAMYIALTGLSAQQYNIDNISYNLDNINTTAFKSTRTDFADALYQQMQKPIQSGSNLQQGSGMLVGAVQRNTADGEPVYSGSPLDFMVNGPGYFTLQGQGGQTLYTRAGDFHVSQENGAGYLVTANGYYVMGSNNQRIKVPGDTADIMADASGNLSLNGVKFATLKVTSFSNPSGLLDMGGSMVQATAASGAPTTLAAPAMLQGWLEGSNVDMTDEMTRLLVAQRAFSSMGTVISTADNMDALANSMSK